MAKLPKSNLRHLAMMGAAARLNELDRERGTILRMFPSLRMRGSSPPAGGPVRRPSAAARRAMSEGMRRFWAKRKAAGKHGRG
jgi:hypothetical protein